MKQKQLPAAIVIALCATMAGMSLAEAVESGSAALNRCLGMKVIEFPIDARVDRRPGDRYLICSDGLFTGLDQADIERTVALPQTLEAIGDRLYQGAIDGGSQDNVSLILLA